MLSDKQKIAQLIIKVLEGTMNVQSALSEFPKSEDINIKCAFDALLYRESDEDIRLKDKDYAIVQDEYLEDIANIFLQNGTLPQNYISEYLKYNKDNLISNDDKTFGNIFKKLKRMINF